MFLAVLLLQHLISIYNNPSVNLATGVAYVDEQTDRRGSGGGHRRRAAKPQLSVARLWYARLWLVHIIVSVCLLLFLMHG